MSLKAKLEAVIYAAEEPATLAQLAALFATDVLEWKAEQEAASAALASEAQTEPSADALPLLAEGFEYLGLDQSLPAEQIDSAPPVSLDAEPDSPPLDQDSAQDLAPVEGAQPAPEAAEPPADSEQEAKRLARIRDREARAIIRTLLDELIADFASDARGVEIREIAGGFRMATKPECHDAVRSFVKSLKPALKLSLPALETLAVIAYKQPVTAPEVNEIRGVDSSGVFGSLLARKLIATAGRKQVIGRPILYKTTREFLLRFGLKDVSELPSMEEFEKMASLELDEPESSPGEESTAATTLDLDFDLDETVEEPVGQGFIPGVRSTESMGALAPEVGSSNSPAQIAQAPTTTQTAEKAGSIKPSSTGESAPAAPPATEQAETENSPHGEEVNQEH
jgi:segregation and condensation protein B